MTAFSYRHRVTFAETNVVGNVYFTHYLDWQGQCRESFLLEHAPNVFADILKGSLALVTVGCAMDYFEECYAGDDVTIEMSPGGIVSSRARMCFQYRSRGAVIARGEQTVACMSRGPDGLIPLPVPDELVTAMQRFE
ncbi:MAG TPA: acyl-CoA thioesterase [Jatrophihabitans sp.]|jgi:enediyne biosynthesis thioesterase|nr:acyl-CoA thioesterase [Jatrophihabitans sp.]